MLAFVSKRHLLHSGTVAVAKLLLPGRQSFPKESWTSLDLRDAWISVKMISKYLQDIYVKLVALGIRENKEDIVPAGFLFSLCVCLSVHSHARADIHIHT